MDVFCMHLILKMPEKSTVYMAVCERYLLLLKVLNH